MLGKAMRFATVCTLAFAICGKANRGTSASFSKGSTEDLEHRFGQETNFEEHLSTTMNVSSILMRKPASKTSSFSLVRKLAAILALSSALTSADAFASPGVQTAGVRRFHKDSSSAFAPIHTNNPLHGTPSGPLHASIDQLDSETIKEMSADEVPEQWKEYFDDLEVMIFSGDRHFFNSRTVGEFEHIANQCIQQSHQRLLDNEELVAEVRQTLSRSALMPWGTRLDVQGQMQSSSCRDLEPGKVSELLCLLRGPQTRSIEMGNYWIGIVRHDETSYMTGRLSGWLVNHICGHGRIRNLVFARNHSSDASVDTIQSAVIWDQDKVDKFNQLITAR